MGRKIIFFNFRCPNPPKCKFWRGRQFFILNVFSKQALFCQNRGFVYTRRDFFVKVVFGVGERPLWDTSADPADPADPPDPVPAPGSAPPFPTRPGPG